MKHEYNNQIYVMKKWIRSEVKKKKVINNRQSYMYSYSEFVKYDY